MITPLVSSLEDIQLLSKHYRINLIQNLQEIIVSASRKKQKIQEAPASVSIIGQRDIENSSSVVDPVRILQNIPGVTLQQNSANSLNLEMRAGSGLFGTSTFALLDYRYLVTPAAGSFLSYQSGISNLDIRVLNISTLPSVNVPDEYFKFFNDFKEVFIISLSSFFSFCEPIISNPI